MGADAEHNAYKRGDGPLVILMVALPLVYALSVGPIIYVAEKFHMAASMKSSVQIFYQPLIWLHDHTALKKPLESYERWWVSLAKR